jgi:hypothetical protein
VGFNFFSAASEGRTAGPLDEGLGRGSGDETTVSRPCGYEYIGPASSQR